YARGRLPAYMVPSSVVVLEALPLTANGKVDRRALPVPQESRELGETGYVAPRTPLEERLVAIWEEVLAVKQVGIYDNFFDLGGHSLLATQIVSQVRKIFQVGLPLRFLFEEPTVANLAEHVEAARQAEQSVQEDAIHPAEQAGNAPLSFAQQRLWFFDQFEPNSAAYNMPAAVRLRGALDVPVLERSLSEIVRRHESLRTTISSEKGHPVQIISPPVSFSLPTVDLQAFPEAEREAQLQAKLVEEIQRPFNLHEGPLLRAVLLKLAEQEHVLVVTMHHIISDGWSMGVFIRELSQLYPAFVQGQKSPLPELPIQYTDYATWQRQWLQGAALQEQLDFWKQLLGEAPAVLNLPTDHPRPPVQTFQGTRQALRLSEELSESLNQFSRQEGATLFMTLLTAFGLLLARYSGQDDLLIGTPIANRNRREVEGLIGFFVNTLVLRCDLRGSPSFREALQRVREMALGAYAHQELPFEKLVEVLQPERDLSRTPLFQVFFNMLTFTFDHVGLPGVQTEILAAPEVEAKFDMTLYVREEGTNILFELVYNANLFDQQRMSEMLDQLRLLLTQVVEQPGENISHYSLVSERAKAILPTPTLSLASAWTGAVHERFAEQSRRQPKNVAVADAQEFWRYEELEVRSNQLANYLQAQHIAPQDVVAVYGHRSASLIWALLGILKAGAAFAILDPTYPALRLVANLRLAQPRGWIQLEAAGELPEAISSSLPEFSLRCCLTLPRHKQDVAQTPLAEASIDNPQLAVGQDDLAYVAFTSGTTGAPRGLLGTHGPLAHFLAWDCQAFALQECDRFSMLSGLAHDPLLRDIFMPLWIGAALVVPEPTHTRSTHELAQWMRQEKVSVAHLTPTLGKLLTGTVAGYSQSPPENRQLPNLRYAFFGGDRLTKQDVLRFRQLAPVATLVNFYGATETPQAMSYFVVPEQVENLNETIPVGRGIQDVQLLILNESHRRAGIGEVGEIYVRTPHLTKGYIGDDALTNKRYLVNPFTHLPIDRLYKTGDRGRYLPDGNVEFLGRADDQVKIRGYRVEIAEIQMLLQHHPAIKDAAVLVLEEEAGDSRLVAYVVPDGHEAMDVSELRTYVKQRLP
ncbi:MAG: amino acid adenylation domain-containing protein, partial [Ktedonobacteraceae bacterium]